MNDAPFKKSILLVDDEEILLKALAKDLECENLLVTKANKGADALRILSEKSFDFVITDLVMPGVDGIELLRRVKEKDPDTGVIILTGYGELDSAVDALRLGAEDYLQKPCGTDELVLRMARFFEKQVLVEQLRAESIKLTESETLMQLLLESASEGIYGLDRQGRVIFINSAGEKMLGYRAEELLARASHPLIHHTRTDGSPYPEDECRMNLAMLENRPIRTEGELLWRKDGSSFPVEYQSAPIRQNGKVIGTVVIFSDISEMVDLKEKQQQMDIRLQQLQRYESLSCLAGGIAHNFNNILTAVLGNLDLALETMPVDQMERVFVDAAMKSGGRAAALSTRMLQYVGQSKANKQSLGMTQLLHELSEILQSQITFPLELVCDVDGEVYFQGDSSLVSQVVASLVTNAAEAMEGGDGKITLMYGQKFFSQDDLNSPNIPDAISPGDYVYLQVVDSGKGMEHDILTRAFEPFFSEKFTGRGMGLASALGIMRIHAGAIFLDSIPGKGTTATLIFPAHFAPQDAAGVPRNQVDGIKYSGTILMADDAPEILAIGEGVLGRMGYKVLTAVDGVEALEIFKKNMGEIVLALLDVAMPNLDGIKTCGVIREQSDVPIIMVTGYQIDQLAINFPETKAIHFLQKPFVVKDLKEKVMSVLCLSNNL